MQYVVSYELSLLVFGMSYFFKKIYYQIFVFFQVGTVPPLYVTFPWVRGWVRVQKLLEHESDNAQKIKVVSPDEQTPKTYFLKPQFQKTAHWCPKNQKPTPKFGQNKKSELTGVQKIKVVQLYKQTPKMFLKLTPTPKLAYWGPKSQKGSKN